MYTRPPPVARRSPRADSLELPAGPDPGGGFVSTARPAPGLRPAALSAITATHHARAGSRCRPGVTRGASYASIPLLGNGTSVLEGRQRVADAEFVSLGVLQDRPLVGVVEAWRVPVHGDNLRPCRHQASHLVVHRQVGDQVEMQ